MSIGRNTPSAEMIRSYVERLESNAVARKEISDDDKAIMAEAKAQGFDPAVIPFRSKGRQP